jgi:hypothetical protein
MSFISRRESNATSPRAASPLAAQFPPTQFTELKLERITAKIETIENLGQGIVCT